MVGWVYESDRDAIKEAQDDLDDFYLDSKISDLEDTKEAEAELLQERIDNWEKYLKMLAAKYDEYNRIQNKERVMELVGVNDWEAAWSAIVSDMTSFTLWLGDDAVKMTVSSLSTYSTAFQPFFDAVTSINKAIYSLETTELTGLISEDAYISLNDTNNLLTALASTIVNFPSEIVVDWSSVTDNLANALSSITSIFDSWVSKMSFIYEDKTWGGAASVSDFNSKYSTTLAKVGSSDIDNAVRAALSVDTIDLSALIEYAILQGASQDVIDEVIEERTEKLNANPDLAAKTRTNAQVVEDAYEALNYIKGASSTSDIGKALNELGMNLTSINNVLNSVDYSDTVEVISTTGSELLDIAYGRTSAGHTNNGASSLTATNAVDKKLQSSLANGAQTDLGTLLTQAITGGASSDFIESLADLRDNKIASSSKYSNVTSTSSIINSAIEKALSSGAADWSVLLREAVLNGASESLINQISAKRQAKIDANGTKYSNVKSNEDIINEAKAELGITTTSTISGTNVKNSSASNTVDANIQKVLNSNSNIDYAALLRYGIIAGASDAMISKLTDARNKKTGEKKTTESLKNQYYNAKENLEDADTYAEQKEVLQDLGLTDSAINKILGTTFQSNTSTLLTATGSQLLSLASQNAASTNNQTTSVNTTMTSNTQNIQNNATANAQAIQTNANTNAANQLTATGAQTEAIGTQTEAIGTQTEAINNQTTTLSSKDGKTIGDSTAETATATGDIKGALTDSSGNSIADSTTKVGENLVNAEGDNVAEKVTDVETAISNLDKSINTQTTTIGAIISSATVSTASGTTTAYTTAEGQTYYGTGVTSTSKGYNRQGETDITYESVKDENGNYIGTIATETSANGDKTTVFYGNDGLSSSVTQTQKVGTSTTTSHSKTYDSDGKLTSDDFSVSGNATGSHTATAKDGSSSTWTTYDDGTTVKTSSDGSYMVTNSDGRVLESGKTASRENGIVGGPITYTGLAMLHGSSANPEYVLNNDQAYTLLRNMSTLKMAAFDRTNGTGEVTNYNVSGDIVLEGVNDPEEFWSEVTSAMGNRFNVTKNK